MSKQNPNFNMRPGTQKYTDDGLGGFEDHEGSSQFKDNQSMNFKSIVGGINKTEYSESTLHVRYWLLASDKLFVEEPYRKERV